jgi:hypothetical protein
MYTTHDLSFFYMFVLHFYLVTVPLRIFSLPSILPDLICIKKVNNKHYQVYM